MWCYASQFRHEKCDRKEDAKKFSHWLKDKVIGIGLKCMWYEWVNMPKNVREEIMSWTEVSFVARSRSDPHHWVFSGSASGTPKKVEYTDIPPLIRAKDPSCEHWFDGPTCDCYGSVMEV